MDQSNAAIPMGGSGSLGGLGRQPWRVLVVDDEENLNWSLVASLNRDQYVTHGALTAEDARRRMTETPYDCVISDVQMPGMDGFQLLAWLREWRPRTRVIMMTAFGSPSVRQEAFRNGVVAYLEKPFDLSALKGELRRALETPVQAVVTYDLVEMTQVINLSRRDMLVQVTVNDRVGTLYFERGELISAEYAGTRGDEAFLAMCVAPAQRATPLPPVERLERNVTQPLSALIFEALLRRDHQTAGAQSGAQSGVQSGAAPRMAGRVSPAVPVAPAPYGTGALRGSFQIRPREPQAVLAGLISAIAQPCAVALVAPDGSVIAQAQTHAPATPERVFVQLAVGFVVFARTAQSALQSEAREGRLATSDTRALVRMIGPRADAPALVVVGALDLDMPRLEAALATHDSQLRELAL